MAYRFYVNQGAIKFLNTDTSKVETFAANQAWYSFNNLDSPILYRVYLRDPERNLALNAAFTDFQDSDGLGFSDDSTLQNYLDSVLSGTAMSATSTLSNRIVLNQINALTILSSPLVSTKEYFIDGIVNLDGLGVNIEVPQGGIELRGYSFDTSKIICSDNSFTLFTSPVTGSGNVLGENFALEITGVGSQVFDLVSDTGFDAFEFIRVNFNDCSSLGTIDNYRQGLENGTGRFGGKPELTLKGVWVGGYFIDTSIVRSLIDGSYSLYKAGAGFLMSSRFRSNQNIDLPASVSFFDFADANFVNPSTISIVGAIVTRSGVFNANDSNITPNITNGSLYSSWSGNTGMKNTFEGGSLTIATEAATVINTQGVFETLNAGSWTSTDLQHFDSPSSGQLRHLGNSPREYNIFASFTIDGTASNEIVLRVSKYDSSTSTTSTVLDQTREINSLVGARDVVFFTININTELDQNDYIFLQIANNSGTANVTSELDSYFRIEKR